MKRDEEGVNGGVNGGSRRGRHNLVYWTHRPFLAAGMGATSFVANRRLRVRPPPPPRPASACLRAAPAGGPGLRALTAAAPAAGGCGVPCSRPRPALCAAAILAYRRGPGSVRGWAEQEMGGAVPRTGGSARPGRRRYRRLCERIPVGVEGP